MGLLTALAGLVIAAYAAVSGVAIMLARRLRAADGEAKGAELLAQGVPAHHVALLVGYAAGPRLMVWQVSLVLLLLSLVALVIGSHLAVYLFGVALIIDCLMFMTVPDRDRLMRAITGPEKAAEIGQTLALLAAFLILAWRQVVNLA